MQTSKKGLWILILVIIIVALGAAGYYYFVMRKTTTPAATAVVWDGTYTMTGSLPCTGNIPNLTAIPMNSTFAVANNKIMEPTIGKSFDIDSRGKATETLQQTNSGVTTNVTANYQFYQEGSAYKFTGTGKVDLSTTQNGQTYSSSCSGSVTGAKQ